MKFSTKDSKTLKVLDYENGQRQTWQHIDLGYESAYKTITGGIFEFGFSDAMLQMFAAFCDELEHGPNMLQSFHCATPEEASKSPEVFTATLKSHNA